MKHTKVRIGKHLPDTFPILGLKQRDAFQFASVYAIGKVKENQVGLTLNGTQELLAYADDVNPFGDNIPTTKKTEILIDIVGREN
jgi:hypothetical protein